MARATQHPGGFRAADQGSATATKSALARCKIAASLAPTPSAALTMVGLRQRTHRDLSENGGSAHPERLRSELLLKLLCSLPHAGGRHQAARTHGMGSGIDEPDPCPSRIKTGRVVLDANRADRDRGGDGRICRRQTRQVPAGATQGRLCQQAHHHTNNPMGTPMHPQGGASESHQPSRGLSPRSRHGRPLQLDLGLLLLLDLPELLIDCNRFSSRRLRLRGRLRLRSAPGCSRAGGSAEARARNAGRTPPGQPDRAQKRGNLKGP